MLDYAKSESVESLRGREVSLSQTPKRPGSRDISELKARLGLKKGGPATPPTKGNGGVVPPPGVSLPAPPGVRQAAPATPNAADDPFGAMNAMAQAGAATRAPEIVIVHDGKPVESVSTHHNIATVVKFAAVALVPLAIGIIIGKIAEAGDTYNAGLKDAGNILIDVKKVKKGLVDLEATLEIARKKGFKVDKTVTTALEPYKELAVNAEGVFKAKQNALDSDVAARVLDFYAGATELSAAIKTHTQAAKADDLALAAAASDAEAAAPKASENAHLVGNSKYRYAVVLSNPGPDDKGGGTFGANVVELGPPFCGDGKMATGGSCSDGVTAFGYRSTPNDTWTKGELAKASPGEPVPAKQIIPLVPNIVLDSLVSKTEATAAEVLYRRRLVDIQEKATKLIEKANELEPVLSSKANAGKRFTFFL